MNTMSQPATAGKGNCALPQKPREATIQMSLTDLILQFNNQKRGDARVTATHMAVFMALAEAWNNQRRPEKFAADIIDLCLYCNMKKSNIYRALQELSEWGYINYRHGTKGAGLPYFQFTIPPQRNDSGMIAEQSRNDSGMIAEHLIRDIREEREEEIKRDAHENFSTGVMTSWRDFTMTYPDTPNSNIKHQSAKMMFMQKAGGRTDVAASIVAGARRYAAYVERHSKSEFVQSAKNWLEAENYNQPYDTGRQMATSALPEWF